MTERIRTAIIGAGRMGRRHLQIVKDLGLPLAGICDARPEALAACTKEAGVPADACFPDPSSLLEKSRPEALIVATTAPGHAPITCEAADRGVRFILCEKPMATSLADCTRMIEACRRSGTRLAINHQMRFMEQYLAVRKVIEPPAFGGWAAISVVAGNFGLAMNGTHYFELFRWLAGEPIQEVAAWFSPEKVVNPRGAEFVDWGGFIRGASKSGRRFYLEAGADQGHGVHVTYTGRHGVVTTDELGGRIHVSIRKAEHRSLPTTRYGMPADEQDLAVTPADALAPSRSVLEALLGGADIPTGEDGRHAVSTLIAAVVSNESNHAPVVVSDATLPTERHVHYA